MGLKFGDRQLANEQMERWNKEGYSASVTQKGGTYYVTRGNDKPQRLRQQDLQAIENEEKLEAIRELSGSRNRFRNMADSFTSGRNIVAAIKRTVSSPTGTRMKIAQMPGRRAPIAMDTNKANPISGRNAGIHRRSISYAPRRED